ncbi:zinc finger MYM-type protein 1-like [Corticium candelabrum]|uniref:zinc finger MYM-type protein 1-like n=1 Tax=Corticium candelabrum TaxID=121492 RepID=UPI002E2772C9|nr:zinc finger MYM-type protein 1-like [Corticium candelabrum]
MKAETDYNLAAWLERKDNTYTSPTFQNEILKVMGLNLLRKLAAEFHKSSFMIVMADETRDASNTEQVVLVIRRVTGCFEVHEEFVGMYQVPCTDAETLTAIISDVFTRMNLTFKKLRGQCYDGARAMSGIKSGVAERIRKIEPRAIFTHCYGHSLSLAASDMVKQVKLLKDSLGVTHEITKLIKYSPRREEIFQRLKENLSSYSKTGIRILSLTRWTHVAGILRNCS